MSKDKKTLNTGSVLVQLYKDKKLCTKVDNMLDEGKTYDYIIEFCKEQGGNLYRFIREVTCARLSDRVYCCPSEPDERNEKIFGDYRPAGRCVDGAGFGRNDRRGGDTEAYQKVYQSL